MKTMPVNAPATHINDFDEAGNFCRPEPFLTTPFGDGEDELPVESGRYLYTWAPVCGWSHRFLIAYDLLGLGDTIKIGKTIGKLDGMGESKQNVYITEPYDYSFEPSEDTKPDFTIEEAYEKIVPGYSGLPFMAVFHDLKTERIVNDDSYANQTYYLEKEFKEFHKDGAPDLLPEDIEEDIKEMNQWIFDNIANGFYKTGFAQSQEVYEKEYDNLFAALDKMEDYLSKNRYVMGDRLTDCDIRLYTPLVRWDVAYHKFFNCNRNRLVDMPNLWNYMKELYQIPSFGKTTDFQGIKEGYYFATNSKGNMPKGPDTSIWNEPHDRDKI